MLNNVFKGQIQEFMDGVGVGTIMLSWQAKRINHFLPGGGGGGGGGGGVGAQPVTNANKTLHM